MCDALDRLEEDRRGDYDAYLDYEEFKARLRRAEDFGADLSVYDPDKEAHRYLTIYADGRVSFEECPDQVVALLAPPAMLCLDTWDDELSRPITDDEFGGWEPLP